MTIDKQKIADATSELDNILVAKTFDEPTQSALIYFTANKDKLKYLLTAYNIDDRHYVLLTHLKSQFGKINVDMLRPALNKEWIWSVKILNFLNFIIPIISICPIYLYYILVNTDTSINFKIIYFILQIIPIFLLAGIIESIFSSKYVPYRIAKEYRGYARPEESL